MVFSLYVWHVGWDARWQHLQHPEPWPPPANRPFCLMLSKCFRYVPCLMWHGTSVSTTGVLEPPRISLFFGCFQFHKKSWTPWTFSTVHLILISKSFCSPVLCCSLSLGRPTSPPICQWLFLPIPSSRNFRWFNWCQLGALRKSFPHPARIQETRRAQASWSNPTS